MYDKFLALLERTNMTASKVAKATNINRSTFSHWKSGDYTPKIETLQKIADYFGVPVRYFYGDTKEKPSYYLDEDTAKLAQEIHDNPELRAMFKASRKLSPKDIETFTKLIEGFKNEG